MIKLSDFVARHLADRGVRHVFMLTGGGAMHLNDSFGQEKRIQYICCHHEQACAIAAEGYARTLGRIAVVNVTTGPGGTNAITGVLGQWLDSIPALYVSGQVRYEMTAASTGLPLRQLGDQEADIIALVRPITKYAVMVTDPKMIRYHLDRAIRHATSGRPGPVWLDIPLDVQASMVDEVSCAGYDPTSDNVQAEETDLRRQVGIVLERMRTAERPLIMAGAGIRLAGAAELFRRVVEALGVPVLTAWDAIDILPSDHPLFAGRPGTVGQRGANFVLQNADMLLCIGCRMNVRQIGYNQASVARAAFKVSVDIDPAELAKWTFKPDLPVRADARSFLGLLDRAIQTAQPERRQSWLDWCVERSRRYPPVTETMREEHGAVNPYAFCDALAGALASDDVVVSANGAACVVPIQSMRIRDGQRHIVNSGCAAMGYGLPAAVGACFANEGRRVICLEGDGSIQLNIQELATVAHHRLPLKIFVFNNGGYLSIRTTQRAFFEGRLVGEGPHSGVGIPDMTRIAEAYGITSAVIRNHQELPGWIRATLEHPGPVLCNVMMVPNQEFVPRVTSRRLANGRMVSSPLEDMYPFLDRGELLSNMIIPLWEPEE
ncbi:thiamine pyrophosphate-binding protein [candidate division WOR-3 bacterium]|uniref:Thiamine pyrophosphate-binding protein n=1 Tax=candidate division WOR-3 bacterium TaxID=2052148 RepID=A0A938BS75_UNCW3|nr:thiamine pyrophosphate-binding protein [candidate division WOR-3 bacterium]